MKWTTALLNSILFVIYYSFIILFIFGCNSGSSSNNDGTPEIDDNVPPIIVGNWYRPDLQVTWQWQLSGSVNTAYDVEIYDIDLFDSSGELIDQLQATGKKVICYFSAGSYEEWRTDEDQFRKMNWAIPWMVGLASDGWISVLRMSMKS